MKREGAEGLAAVDRRSPTANEEFTERANGLDRPAPPPLGWDPYEVWRTRVKGFSPVMQERKVSRLRWRLRLALRGRRLPTTLNARP
jgi:hypothetical protein